MWLDHRTNMMATERYSIQLTQGSRALRGLGLSGNSLLGGYTNPTPPHLDFTITITRPMPAFGLRRESFPTCQNKFSIIFMKVQTPQKRPDPKHPHTQTLPLLSFVQTTRSSSSSVQTTVRFPLFPWSTQETAPPPSSASWWVGWVGVHILGLVGRPDMVKGASSTRGGFDWYTRILGVVAKPF